VQDVILRGFSLVVCGSPSVLSVVRNTTNKASSDVIDVSLRVDMPIEREGTFTAEDLLQRANIEIAAAGAAIFKIVAILGFTLERYVIQSGSGSSSANLGIYVGVGTTAALAGAVAVFALRRRRKRGVIDIKRRIDIVGDDASDGAISARSFASPDASDILHSMAKVDDMTMHFSDSSSGDDDLAAPSSGPMPELAKIKHNSFNPREEAMIDFLNNSDEDSSDDDMDSIGVPETPAPFLPSPRMHQPGADLPALSAPVPVQGVQGSRLSMFHAQSPAIIPGATPGVPATSGMHMSVTMPGMVFAMPGVPQQAPMRPLSTDINLPVELHRENSQFWTECTRVFNWLDDDHDGFISDREISSYLGISRQEARALIEETKITLYGKRGDNRLKFDEFSAILARTPSSQPVQDLDINTLPPRLLKRYRIIFDSIDIDGNGVITPAELAQDMGIGDVDDAMQGFLADTGFGEKSELTFEEFVRVLRRAESDHAGRTFQNILAGTKEGSILATATEARHTSVTTTVKKEEVPLIINIMWDRIAQARGVPRDVMRVDSDTLQTAVLEAHNRGELQSSDQDLLHLVWQITEIAGSQPDNLVDFQNFAKILKSSVADHSDPALRALARIDSEPSSSEAASSVELPSQTLNPDELKALRGVFNDSDQDKDGFLKKDELQQMVMEMIERSMLTEDLRTFYFEVINGLEQSGDPHIDFEQFVILMQEAAETSASDINAAMSALNLMKKRISRRSLNAKMFRSDSKSSGMSKNSGFS